MEELQSNQTVEELLKKVEKMMTVVDGKLSKVEFVVVGTIKETFNMTTIPMLVQMQETMGGLQNMMKQLNETLDEGKFRTDKLESKIDIIAAHLGLSEKEDLVQVEKLKGLAGSALSTSQPTSTENQLNPESLSSDQVNLIVENSDSAKNCTFSGSAECDPSRKLVANIQNETISDESNASPTKGTVPEKSCHVNEPESALATELQLNQPSPPVATEIPSKQSCHSNISAVELETTDFNVNLTQKPSVPTTFNEIADENENSESPESPKNLSGPSPTLSETGSVVTILVDSNTQQQQSASLSPLATNRSKKRGRKRIYPVGQAPSLLKRQRERQATTGRPRGRPRKYPVGQEPYKRRKPTPYQLSQVSVQTKLRRRRSKKLSTKIDVNSKQISRTKRVRNLPKARLIIKSRHDRRKVMDKMLGNDGRRKFPCGLCPRVYTCQTTRYVHKRSVHEGRPWKCKFCGRVEKYPANLWRHQREVHANLLSFRKAAPKP